MNFSITNINISNTMNISKWVRSPDYIFYLDFNLNISYFWIYISKGFFLNDNPPPPLPQLSFRYWGLNAFDTVLAVASFSWFFVMFLPDHEIKRWSKCIFCSLMKDIKFCPKNEVNIYTNKTIFWHIHEKWYLLKIVPESYKNQFCYFQCILYEMTCF